MEITKLIRESIDLSGVGQVDVTWDFDEEEYLEWLNDSGYKNNIESLNEYIRNNVSFDLEYFDNDTYHHMGFDTVGYSGLEDSFGEAMTMRIIGELKEDGQSSFETLELYNGHEFDVNNPDELNGVAVKILKHGEYYKGCRGFILTNGVIVYTPAEHNMVSQINGIKGTFDFIKKGNIRILNQSIDLSKEPTKEQKEVLRKVIASYSDEELYVDILTENGDIGAHYVHPDWRLVMGEIERFFREGIRPLGDINESVERSHNDLFGLSINKFGTTNDIRECGYILPDGTMLDFSGRHMVNGDSSFLSGRRSVDHREIYILGWSDDENTKNFNITMSDFIKLGAIRTNVTSSYSYFTIFQKPTNEQIYKLKQMIRYSKGCVDVEIGDGNDSLSYAEYEDAGPLKVISDINRYFDEGIKLIGSVNESVGGNVMDVRFVGECDDMKLIINGKEAAKYFFTDSTAYPFIIYNNHLYLGNNGETHANINRRLNREGNDSDGIFGRIWIKAKVDEFNYSVVAFWGEKHNSGNYKPYVYEVAKQLKVNPEQIIVVIDHWGNIKSVPLSEWNGKIHETSESEIEKRNLHMMSPEKKRDNTSDFRNTRDKNIGKKLTDGSGNEMPMAQYHNMIYQECKNIIVSEEQYNRLFNRKTKEIKINEGQYNRLFDFAK